MIKFTEEEPTWTEHKESNSINIKQQSNIRSEQQKQHVIDKCVTKQLSTTLVFVKFL